MRIFLVTTDHFTDHLWFKDDEDFKAGMNYVAVVSLITGIKVLAFILMSNHVHFVLCCSESEAKHFIDTYKRLYGGYFARKYIVKDYFRKVGVDIRDVTDGDESAERAIAYVHMNAVAANICASPFFYPWGTGACFFNENPQVGRPIGELSRRAQIKMTRSNVKFPSSIRFSSSGYILPESFVNVKGVEHLFKTPKRYRFFLRNSSKAKRVLENDAFPSFRDQSILASSIDLCQSLFKADGPDKLTWEQKAELLKQLRFRFNADVNQLCRVIGIPYNEAATMLNF
ncbi:MAG: hypothetical protein K6E37_05525 [Bacteroidales bacterium]|nr:hypothetical protein [Bacteroidales bacterium]